MKSRDLADVLLKILGLYFCLIAIPGFLSGIVYAVLPPVVGTLDWNLVNRSLMILATAGLQAGIGILIIGKSRKIAAYWFKNEDA
jgi:hypothetical protein